MLVSPRTAFWISDILLDPEARAYIFGRGGHLEFPFPVAVKTGTSQAYHDNWTIGYTRNVTVGVWVGNFDRTPLRDSTGVTGAGPIFHAVMLAAERRTRAVRMPDALDASGPPAGTEQRDICALSGMIANAWCPTHQREWLPSGEDIPAAGIISATRGCWSCGRRSIACGHARTACSTTAPGCRGSQ
jgi:penicillin-binding protein 1C